MSKPKIAFLFPGQGSQYVGMGRDFYDNYPEARHTFEEGEDLLKKNLINTTFNGPEEKLTETDYSQLAIYMVSMALYNVVDKLFPDLEPTIYSGLSLGEYTALTTAKIISYQDCLPIVERRGQFMSDACEATEGAMAVVLGLNSDTVENLVFDLNLANDLWVANFNCPGQIVISGTPKGIEAGAEAAKNAGAKRVLPLQVHGAFHSGLMRSAEEKLKPYIDKAVLNSSETKLVMNVPGDFESDLEKMKENLIKQVTHSVRWEQGIQNIQKEGVDLFIEIGCGKTLSGMNKRIGTTAPTISIEKIDDLKKLETVGNLT